jgi:hypothetical protein
VSAPLFRGGRRVPSKDSKIEIRDEGAYLRWRNRAGAFYARSALLPAIAGGESARRLARRGKPPHWGGRND